MNYVAHRSFAGLSCGVNLKKLQSQVVLISDNVDALRHAFNLLREDAAVEMDVGKLQPVIIMSGEHLARLGTESLALMQAASMEGGAS